MNKIFVFILIFLLIVSSDFDKFINGFRFFKYLIIVPSIYIILKNKKIRLNPISKFYLVITIYSIFLYILGVHEKILINELIIYIGIVLTCSSTFLSNIKESYIFLSLLIYFLIFILIEGLKINPIGLLIGDFSSIESNIIAFISPIIFYYLFQKNASLNKKIISSAFVLLSIKRITLIGILSFFLFRKKENSKIIKTMYLIPIFTFIGAYFLSDSYAQEKVSEYLNISIGLLTMGRSSYFTFLYENIDWNWINFLFGYGIGFPQNIIEIELGKKFLLHNDWLKLFIEQGFIGLIIFIYFLRKLNPIILLTLFIWMVTDNILVYFPVLILISWYHEARKNNFS